MPKITISRKGIQHTGKKNGPMLYRMGWNKRSPAATPGRLSPIERVGKAKPYDKSAPKNVIKQKGIKKREDAYFGRNKSHYAKKVKLSNSWDRGPSVGFPRGKGTTGHSPEAYLSRKKALHPGSSRMHTSTKVGIGVGAVAVAGAGAYGIHRYHQHQARQMPVGGHNATKRPR